MQPSRNQCIFDILPHIIPLVSGQSNLFDWERALNTDWVVLWIQNISIETNFWNFSLAWEISFFSYTQINVKNPRITFSTYVTFARFKPKQLPHMNWCEASFVVSRVNLASNVGKSYYRLIVFGTKLKFAVLIGHLQNLAVVIESPSARSRTTEE